MRQKIFFLLICIFFENTYAENRKCFVGGALDRHYVLASLLQGDWVENNFYSLNDFIDLNRIGFSSNSMRSHGDYVETLLDYKRCMVLRKSILSVGVRNDTIKIDKELFWCRVFYIDNVLIENTGHLLFGEVGDSQVMKWCESRGKE